MYVSAHVSEGWEIPEVEKKVVVVMLGGGLADGSAESGQTKRYVLIPPALTSKTAGNEARLALHSTAPDCCWGLCVFFGPGTVITSLLLSFSPPDLKTRRGPKQSWSLHRPMEMGEWRW